MVRVEVDADDAYEKALARRAKPEKDETPQKKSRKKTITDEETIQKKKIKALEKEVKLLVQSIRLKFREHTVEERILKNKIKYGEIGSYLRNVGVSGVYGPGGAEKDSGYKPSGLPPKKGKDKGMGALVGAGVGAAALMLLVSALHKATAQSKIVGVVESSINKALGLMLDLVLLPFLPLITQGIIKLYEGIMKWNEAYREDPFGTIAKNIGDFKTLMLGLMGGPQAALISWIGNWIAGWFYENIAKPTIASLTDWFPGFKASWDAFGVDPLKALKTAWTTTWDALVKYLYNLPIIGDALRALTNKPDEGKVSPVTPTPSAGVGKNTIADWASRPSTTFGVGNMGVSPGSEARIIIDVQGLQDAQLQTQIKNIFDGWIRSHLFTTPGGH